MFAAMKSRIATSLRTGLFLLALAAAGAQAAPNALNQWPHWRGPLANGSAPQADPPIEWSETNAVRWKVKTPGRGTSTPILWNDRVYLLAAVPADAPAAAPPAAATAAAPAAAPAEPAAAAGRGGGGMSEAPTRAQKFTVLAYDRATGKVTWQHTPREQLPHAGYHRDHGYASASPVTDGEVLICHFGSYGTYAYDLSGKLLWQVDLGDMRTRNSFGEGSSPVIHNNLVLILWDHEEDDFLVALDRLTGREVWRQARNEPTGWCTPLLVTRDGKSQVVVNGTNKVRSYDPATGTLLWECGGQTANPIPSPVLFEDRVLVTSGFRGSALQAIRLDRTGDITGTDAILWSYNKHTPYVPSPLLAEGLLYLFSGNEATLSVVDARTGQRHVDAERIEGLRGVYASPAAAAGRVYLVGRDGGTVVLRRGPTVEVLARNKLEDGFDASPAFAGSELFLRGRENLYCLAAAK
jgi:outer membrane protein assembly factor BamB